MSYILFDGPDVRQDKAVKDQNNKSMIFLTHEAAKKYANIHGLAPFTIVNTKENPGR